MVWSGSREGVWCKVKPEKKAGVRARRAQHAEELGSDLKNGIIDAVNNENH